MIRIAKAKLRYEGFDGSGGRAAAISRQALEILRAELGHHGVMDAEGRVGRLRVSIEMRAGASDDALARRIAGAVSEKLPSTARGG